MKKENSDKTVPVALLMHPFIFFFFKVALANDIKMVIKVNHAKMLKECIVTSSKPFLCYCQKLRILERLLCKILVLWDLVFVLKKPSI